MKTTIKKLQEQFVPYGVSLQLREVGFDEPCFLVYHDKKLVALVDNEKTMFPIEAVCNSKLGQSTVAVPLYQQALDWFEEIGFRNYVASNVYDGKTNYWFAITEPEHLTFTDSEGRKSKKDAQIACLRKMIEFKKHNNERNIS